MTTIKHLKKKYWARMTLWQKIRYSLNVRYHVETWLEMRRFGKEIENVRRIREDANPDDEQDMIDFYSRLGNK